MGRHTRTHQHKCTQTSGDGLTTSTFVAQRVANILTNIVTYIVVDMYPNVASDVYTVFSTCLVTNIAGVETERTLPIAPPTTSRLDATGRSEAAQGYLAWYSHLDLLS